MSKSGSTRTRSTEYRIWCGIKSRCTNPNHDAFSRYGGRGIGIHPEWATSFDAFLRDVGYRPSRRHTIDRKQNDLGYVPSNVRWATPDEQQNNKRTTRRVGTEPLQYVARRAGIHPETIARRIERGMDPGLASSLPIDPTKAPKIIECNGRRLSAKDWGEIVGISPNLICKRLRRGWPVELALTPSNRRPR